MTTAEKLVDCLQQEGVEYIFGVPGEENEDLLFAIDEKEDIAFVPCRHEQGAAFMANVWGRLTGKAGVCMSTLGPGATNLVTGVADAHLDKAPLVAITAQGSLQRLHHESHQNLDITQIFEPITKWNTSISTPQIVTETVRKAFKLAEMEKPGATHIELPEDVAMQELPKEMPVLQDAETFRPAPNGDAMLKVLQQIKRSAFPLILAGNGAIRKTCSDAIKTLVEYTKIPVATTFMGKGAIPDDSPQSLMAIGLNFDDYISEAFEKADLIISVGFDIAEHNPKLWNPRGNKRIIHIDYEHAEVYQHYQPIVEMIGDITTTLKKLYNQLTMGDQYRNLPVWYADIRERIHEDIASYDLEPDTPVFHVPGVLNVLREKMNRDALLISDVGSHKMWIARNFKTFQPGGCLISNGLASMGIALPGAIAAALRYPDRQVVAVAGDGGFMMNVQELATAKRLNLNITYIVLKDDDYSLISWKQKRHQGKSTGTQLNNPDFVKLAESFDIIGYRPETPAELSGMLDKALSRKGIHLIEVPVDPSINQALTEKLESYFANEPEKQKEAAKGIA